GLARVEAIVADARERGAALIVLPDATLGGYLSTFRVDEGSDPPPTLERDGPELARVRAVAGDAVVCLGYCESDGVLRRNTAVCLTGDGLLGVHHKVHLPPPDRAVYEPGDRFEPFDTPVGRV